MFFTGSISKNHLFHAERNLQKMNEIALGRSFNQCSDRRSSWHGADNVSFTCHISGWIYVPIGWASIDGWYLARCVLFTEKDQSSNKFLTWIWGATRGSHSFLSLAGWSKAGRPVTSLYSWIGVVALRVVLKQMVPDVETAWAGETAADLSTYEWRVNTKCLLLQEKRERNEGRFSRPRKKTGLF